VKCAEQNLYARARDLVGDRDPRGHEFSVQLRAFDNSRSGTGTGVGALLALCSAVLQKSIRGGLIVVGQLNLGGSIDPIYGAVNVAELAIEKGAATLLVPISTRKQLVELSDDMAARLNIQFYVDGRDALLKALVE
jgi:ATP-dependent Lon protease